MLPRGCDCVVPVEEIETRDGWVRITGDVTRGQFIHRAGSDARRGKVLVPPGKVLDGPAIAVAASVGKTRLRVAQRPAIAIVSTGNELVDVGERPLPHQIRLSNSHALAASLRLRGFRNVTFHRTGDAPPEQVLRRTLKADIVLLTGGVSKGRFDVVPEMLKRLGVREVFHRVRQRPGKPLWFGVATALCRREGADAPTERGGYNTLVFGLPGNPVSCLVCLHRYVLPLLVGTDRRAVRRETARRARRSRPTIVLTKPVRQGSLTVFLPVNNGVLVNLNTSGDFADLAKSDGFVEIPEGTGYVRRVRYWSWK
jgi:molybdopterin molybdotransferase